MSLDVKNDFEERKRIISECLKMEIELKRLKMEWRVKKQRNLRIKQNNKLFEDKLLVMPKRQLEDEHWQVIKVKECRVVLVSVGNREKNEIKTTKQAIKNFKCQHPECKKILSSRTSFYLHMNIHNKRFQCQVCSRCFGSFSSLQTHLVVHTGERLFVCDWVGCGKRYKDKQNLEQHIIYYHSDERPFKCNEIGCDKSFKMKLHLQNHLDAVHSSQRPFQCQVIECDKRFKTKSQLIEHLKYVHGDIRKTFQCQHPECEKKFRINWLLNQHMNLHAKKNQCEFCQKSFETPFKLRTHLRIHTDERPFACEWNGCGKRFKQKACLEKHIQLRHSDERPFKCDQNGCGKAFKLKYLLKQHLVYHSADRPFQCQVKGCGWRSKTKGCLKSHVKNVHFDI